MIGLDGFVEVARFLEHDPEVVVPVRRVRHDRKTFLDQRDRIVAAPELVREDAREMQRAGIVRIDFENLAEHHVRFLESIVPLKIDRNLERLVNRQLARWLIGLRLGRVVEQVLHMLTKHFRFPVCAGRDPDACLQSN